MAWEELLRRYDDALASAIQDAACYGLNSIIACRTWLDISPLSRSDDQSLQALEDLADGGMLSQDEAQETAGLILAQNAGGLYGLDD